MSDDLISRQAAIAYAISGLTREIDGENWIRVSEVRESIKALSSPQPEIIRCKDCKYNLSNERQYDDSDQIMTYVWCNTEAFQENDFCSKGKRREE